MELNYKKRSYHLIPGRLRVEIYGLKGNPKVALHIEHVFSSLKGILYLEVNVVTGKILLRYDQSIIPLRHLCFYLCEFEERLVYPRMNTKRNIRKQGVPHLTVLPGGRRK